MLSMLAQTSEALSDALPLSSMWEVKKAAPEVARVSCREPAPHQTPTVAVFPAEASVATLIPFERVVNSNLFA